MKTILVTGGCGFIGSNLIHLLIKNRPSWRIVNLDKLTYAANPENLKSVGKKKNYEFIKGDI
ncbi:MAG: GDP-mannose 4,6-dehydratase, partial [Actinobacteria bacterium]|nr:GDP-mannose 4,6-dehydratase [Actinomycetota bacterium]